MNDFQLTFVGEGLTPDSVRAGEIAEILQAVEDLLVETIHATHSAQDKNSLLISLVEIHSGSLNLGFASQAPELVKPAFERVSSAIVHRQIQNLPETTYEPLRMIIKFLKIHNGEANLILNNGVSKILATVPQDLVLPKSTEIAGETILYGEIVRVGGVDPKVEIKTINGKTLYCPFDRALATELGSLLYQTVGLSGTAKWDSRSFEIKEFKVQSIIPYRESPLLDAFEQLQAAAGQYYESIDDVIGYVNSLRGENMEE